MTHGGETCDFHHGLLDITCNTHTLAATTKAHFFPFHFSLVSQYFLFYSFEQQTVQKLNTMTC